MTTASARLRPLIAAPAAAVVVLGGLAVVLPEALAVRAPRAHVALETAAAIVAALAAVLVLGRFSQRGRRREAVLGVALAALAAGELAFAAVPAALEPHPTRFAVWASLAARLACAAGVAAAAFAPDAPVRHARRLLAVLAAAAATLLAAIGAAAAVLAPGLPRAIDPSLSPAGDPIAGGGAVRAANVALMCLCLIAAVGFARLFERDRDRLLGWISAAAALAGLAALAWALFPSEYSSWVYAGDYLRLASWLVVLAGVAGELTAYQRRIVDGAALEERRRLARELHDGLAQELAFMATQTRWLERRLAGARGLDQLARSAERALRESRSAIASLTRAPEEPLAVAVAEAAEEVAARDGVRVALALDSRLDAAPDTRDALVRIVREAVSNTARHGRASLVRVELSGGETLRLRVDDDGVGFDPAEAGGSGFGLASMSERARAVGGELRVSSAPGAGTEIEVTLP